MMARYSRDRPAFGVERHRTLLRTSRHRTYSFWTLLARLRGRCPRRSFLRPPEANGSSPVGEAVGESGITSWDWLGVIVPPPQCPLPVVLAMTRGERLVSRGGHCA